MKYLDTPQALVWWDEEIKSVAIEWRGYADGQEYRNILNIMLDALKKHSATKLLGDNRRMKVMTQEDQAWTTNDWGRQMVTAGLKWSAIVVPQSAVAKLSLSRVITTNPPPPGAAPPNTGTTLTFDNLDDARAWLRSID